MAAGRFADGWLSADGQILSSDFATSLVGASVLDTVKLYAVPIPPRVYNQGVATTAIGAGVAEGKPKPVTHFTINTANATPLKGIAIAAFGSGLLSDPTASALIELELRKASIAASDGAFLAGFTITPATGGSTAMEDLVAGLKAAGAGREFVVAAPADWTRELALACDGRMAVSGGQPFPGVTVVGTSQVTKPTVIVADHVGLADLGIRMDHAEHATLQMDSAPDNPATASTVMTSLWQQNLTGVLVERQFHVVFGANAVEVS